MPGYWWIRYYKDLMKIITTTVSYRVQQPSHICLEVSILHHSLTSSFSYSLSFTPSMMLVEPWLQPSRSFGDRPERGTGNEKGTRCERRMKPRQNSGQGSLIFSTIFIQGEHTDPPSFVSAGLCCKARSAGSLFFQVPRGSCIPPMLLPAAT